MWTRDAPTKVGWYWWRQNSDEADCVCIQRARNSGELVMLWIGWDGFINPNSTGGEFWSERIEQPPSGTVMKTGSRHDTSIT